MAVETATRGDIFSSEGLEGYTQDDGAMRISTAERVAELQLGQGLSYSAAMEAVHGRGEDAEAAMDPATKARIAAARQKVKAALEMKD